MAGTVITLDGFDMKKLIDGGEIEIPVRDDFWNIKYIVIKTSPNAGQYIREALKED